MLRLKGKTHLNPRTFSQPIWWLTLTSERWAGRNRRYTLRWPQTKYPVTPETHTHTHTHTMQKCIHFPPILLQSNQVLSNPIRPTEAFHSESSGRVDYAHGWGDGGTHRLNQTVRVNVTWSESCRCALQFICHTAICMVLLLQHFRGCVKAAVTCHASEVWEYTLFFSFF